MLRLSYAESIYAPATPIEFESASALADWLEALPSVVDKESSPIIIPAVFNHYPVSATERTLGNALYSTAAVLDFDSGKVDPEHVADELDKLGVDFVIKSTFSSTPEHPRFFALVPWTTDCPVEKHGSAIEEVRLRLNGSGGFAPESRVAVQPRFVCGNAATETTIYTPATEEWDRHNLTIDYDLLETTSDGQVQQYDALAYVESSPESRMLFKLALNHIDADAQRDDWIAILGAGLRIWGITKPGLRSGLLSDDQWQAIADLEDWCSRGSSDKYTTPSDKKGISTCTRTRKNADGDMVPSMVVEHGGKLIKGNRMMQLTGVIKKIEDYDRFVAELEESYPELVREANNRRGVSLASTRPVPTEAEVAAANTRAQAMIGKEISGLEEYKVQCATLFDRMPEGRAKTLSRAVASAGHHGMTKYEMMPPLAVSMACQFINVVAAGRVRCTTGGYDPMGMNTYVFSFAESGSGKSSQLDFGLSILNAAGYGNASLNTKLHSSSGLFNTFLSKGMTLLLTSDEAKGWFSGKLGGEKSSSAGNQSTLDAKVLELWSKSAKSAPPMQLDARAADRVGPRVIEVPDLHRPSMSTFVVGVPADMSNLTDAMLADGTLARALIFMPTDTVMGESSLQRAQRQSNARNARNRSVVEDTSSADAIRKLGGDLLRAFDADLESQGLGAALATVINGAAAVDFDDAPDAADLPANDRAVYRDLTTKRNIGEGIECRVLTSTPETRALTEPADYQFSTDYSMDKLMPIRNRFTEKILRLACLLTIFDDPHATTYSVPHIRFAIEVVFLAEKRWLDNLLSKNATVDLQNNKFKQYEGALAELLVPGSFLHSLPAGISVREVLRPSELEVLAKLLRYLKSPSEVLVRDATTMLSVFGLMPVKNPKGKGMRIYHPDFAPESGGLATEDADDE